MRKRHVDARLLVIGTGPKAREYRRYVGLRQIRDVEFLGRVSDDAKARYFASADIFCAPATGQESFGIVLLEAMAAGVPIVASDIHGYKNVVQRGVQGLLVEPQQPSGPGGRPLPLSNDADLRHRMGEAGRAKAPEYSAGTASPSRSWTSTTRSASGRWPPGAEREAPSAFPTAPE